MKEHHLKTWSGHFEAVIQGVKTFEVRKDDRGFRVGDILILKEYDPQTEQYTGREARQLVIYIMSGGQFGIQFGYCVMGIEEDVK